jgi:hypothetical protein
VPEVDLNTTVLSDLCQDGNVDAINESCRNASQSHLRLLAPAVIKCARGILGSADASAAQKTATLLALLYVTTDSELSKIRLWPFDVTNDWHRAELLSGLPKERIGTFAARILELSPRHFGLVRAFVEDGYITKPRSNEYVAGFINNLSWPNKNKSGLKKLLQSEPDYLSEDVWLLFEHDGTADNCLSSADKYLTNAAESWHSVLIEFSNEGILDRDRLIDASLSALGKGFNQFRSGWYSRFHEGLVPTAHERARRSQTYLELLSSPTPPTVSFAIEALLIMARAGLLSFEKVRPYIAPALAARSKSTVLAALKVLELCGKRDDADRNAIALYVIMALFEQNADVQSKALTLIAQFADMNDPQLIESFAQKEPAILASVRSKIPSALLPAATAATLITGEPQAFRPAASAAAPEVDAAITARLPRISNLDDLIFKAAALLENPNSPSDYELVLDGVSRLCGERPSDFSSKTSAILKRARQHLNKKEDVMLLMLCRLLIAWITGARADETDRPDRWVSESVFTRLHTDRINAVIERVIARTAICLLSTPTQEFGWLHFDQFKTRLHEWKKLGSLKFDQIDLSFALLRLPELCSLQNNENSEFLAELKALLSSNSAFLSNPVVSAIQANYAGPGSLFRGQYQWTITHQQRDRFHFSYVNLDPDPVRDVMARLQLEPSLTKEVPGRWVPPSSIVGTSASILSLTGWSVPVLSETLFAVGCQWLGQCLDYSPMEVSDKPAKYFFEPLFDRSRKIAEMGHLLIVLGMSVADYEISIASRDALIELIDSVRLRPDFMASAMHKLFHDGRTIKLVRWTKQLMEVARASEQHAEVVYCLLQAVLSNGSPPAPKDLHHLLELLGELKARGQRQLTDSCRDYLSAVSTGGKTGNLIRAMLK